MTRFFPIFLAPVLLAIILLCADTLHAAEQRVPVAREQVTLTFAPVVKKATPAVVNIYTRKLVQNQTPLLLDDPFFRRFFGDGLGGFQRERVQNSLGSGVIVRASGVVITNNHVAGDADQITVVLSDRREFEAKIIGKDEHSDLAVLQLQGVKEPLPWLDLANSDDSEVGDLVLAIGNPFGVGQTVTSGIVSGLARTGVGASDLQSFIQTDAAINPGNSGGALITSDGRLIGINTAIFSRTGGNIGIGFAIPSNMARTVLTSILKEGHAVRAWLGASGKTITADLAKSLALNRPSGVVIDRVVPHGPAAGAGLAVGDIVRTVNGREVHDIEELRYTIASLPIGGQAAIGTLRQGAERNLQLPLAAPPDLPARKKTQLSGRQPFAGAIAANLNPALADELSMEYVEPGVILIEVAPRSIAQNVGLQPGDVILNVNDKPIKTVDDLVQVLSVQAQGWVFTVNRGGQTLPFRISG
ncbi:MAG: DegQ family serine endoprotease [Rhodospirillaceae bacterium]|nr:DegQ family serine endoprotease [Rhodospirillaceae bacterium]